jgi:hypothetical protein
MRAAKARHALPARRDALAGERVDAADDRQVVPHEVVEADVERALGRHQVAVADAGAEEILDAVTPVAADRVQVDRWLEVHAGGVRGHRDVGRHDRRGIAVREHDDGVWSRAL